MEISRLTFTKETKDKMEKGISQFRKGELRWQKLQELENTGKLSKARNRQDITSMMGLGTGYGAPYTWLSNMISRGSIKEILLGFDKNERPEYEYHLTNENKPNYERFGKSNRPKPSGTPALEQPVIVERATMAATDTVITTRATIKYGDLVIELEGIDSRIIENIVSKLANK